MALDSSSAGNQIANAATYLAWPVGTARRVWKYPGGNPTQAFKAAKVRVYSAAELKGMRKAHFKAGASCDMFTATSIRYTGYDTKFPPRISQQIPWMQKNPDKWKEIKYNRSSLLPGDIMFYKKKNKKYSKPSHVFIYTGNGYIAQASAGSYYGKNQKLFSESDLKAKKWVRVFRATKGAASLTSTVSTGAGTQTVNAPTAFVAMAKSQVGVKETGNNNVKYNTWYYGHTVSGTNYAWCASFIAWCANQVFGNNKIIPKNAMAHYIQTGVVEKGGAWILNGSFTRNTASASKCKPGDIITFDPNHNNVADHVGIIEKVKGNTLYTIEGNHGDKVASVQRKISEVFRVARPKWPDGTFNVTADGQIIEGGAAATFVHPEQLYSSASYAYANIPEEEDEFTKIAKVRQESVKSYLNSLVNMQTNVENVAIPDVVLGNISSGSNIKKPATKFEGSISGASLPCTTNYVEAPYAQVTLGGVTIGTYKGYKNYPNYMNSVSVKKTNGSLNEYTINLTHQISAGDNPNYIDNLISANGYNKIKIEYGDAEAGIAYRDINALLVNAQSNFDFFNNCINYTLQATSSSVMSAVCRRNYAAVTDKPSNIINNMLYNSGELLQYFPAMSNQSFVNSNNLIPSNDIKVNIDAVENTTPLNYMNKLVSYMKSTSGDYTYYLNINDESNNGSYFKIEQIRTKLNSSMFPLIYEVDINYPDEKSLVYNFSVNTDYAWPLAYEYAGSIPTYNYNINNLGEIIKQQSTANIKSTNSTLDSIISDNNWWRNVTEFPVSATLEIKGLTSYVLLLNYIKVNVFYFGNKRDSSGIYIVVGQEDSLSGNGFRTKLDLLRVAGDNQYITVDGRVVS